MSKFKVVVTDYVFEKFTQEEQILKDIDASLVVCQAKRPDELKDEVRDADALLNTYLGPIDRNLFEVAKKLRVVVRYGIGVDTINVKDATEFGIMVCNVPDYCINEVADHALALFLSLARKVVLSDRNVKGGDWSLSYVKPLKGITDMTAGIVGFGRIGQAIARRVQALGTSIVFSDPVVADGTLDYKRVDFDTLLETADVVFVQCPANKATHHLINRDSLAKMKQKPFLINAARGSIVDTDAVVWALQNGHLSGAGLDLLDDEDAVVKTDHPFKQMNNVILTPHSAWYSARAVQQLQKMAAEEVARVLKGAKPKGLVNPEAKQAKRSP